VAEPSAAPGLPVGSSGSLLVTGGGGFVGGNFVRLVLTRRPGASVTVFDSLDGRTEIPVLEGLEAAFPGRFRLVRGRVTDAGDLERLFGAGRFDAVLHFAAKNPSGLQVEDPLAFVRVNVMGTAMLLEAARKAWGRSPGSFLHLSSYEVYGSGASGVFHEESPLNPTTPYAASKAAADQLVLAYRTTFGFRSLITRTTNIYGPFQSADKLIPSVVEKVRRRGPIPVFGGGGQVRDWIHVDDHNGGVLRVLEEGEPGRVYHLGARCERTNLEVVRLAARAAAEVLGRRPEEGEALITFAADREAHDARRALDPSRTERELGFRAGVSFEEGLRATVESLLVDRPPGEA
jgi:dTDP-glucose 4,6-dehydratase